MVRLGLGQYDRVERLMGGIASCYVEIGSSWRRCCHSLPPLSATTMLECEVVIHPDILSLQFLKFVEKVAPIGVYTSGKGSSAAGAWKFYYYPLLSSSSGYYDY